MRSGAASTSISRRSAAEKRQDDLVHGPQPVRPLPRSPRIVFGPGNVGGLYTFGSPRSVTISSRQISRPRVTVSSTTPILSPTCRRPVCSPTIVTCALNFIDSTGRIISDPTTFNIIDSNFRGHFQSLKAGWNTFNPSTLKKTGQVIRDAVSQRDFSTIGEKLESFNLDFIPLAALADHSPIYYTLRIWNVAPAR